MAARYVSGWLHLPGIERPGESHASIDTGDPLWTARTAPDRVCEDDTIEGCTIDDDCDTGRCVGCAPATAASRASTTSSAETTPRAGRRRRRRDRDAQRQPGRRERLHGLGRLLHRPARRQRRPLLPDRRRDRRDRVGAARLPRRVVRQPELLQRLRLPERPDRRQRQEADADRREQGRQDLRARSRDPAPSSGPTVVGDITQVADGFAAFGLFNGAPALAGGEALRFAERVLGRLARPIVHTQAFKIANGTQRVGRGARHRPDVGRR